jgi:hypothetical protein
MRRPAHHHLGPVARTWAHPYHGVAGLAVFYNDGGQNPAVPPVVPPTTDPAGDPPRPGPPAVRTFTQAEVEALAAREKAQGKRSAAKEFAEKHGFGTIEDAEEFIAAARKAQEDTLSEQERAQKQLAEDRARVESERTTLAAERRTLRREQALARLGAVDITDDQGNVIPNLADALAMLDRDLSSVPDADEQAVTEAATRLKARRPELFGAPATAPAGGQMPPAPGGAPAGGPPPRQVPAGKPGDRGREMARLRGHVRDSNAA